MNELCRKCGELLLEFSLCVRCKESIQQICSTCKKTTEEQFHQYCTYQLHILKIFPITPDTWFEKRKISNVSPIPISHIKNKITIPMYEKNNAILAIAKVLEKVGRPVLEQVCNNLYSKYRCYLIECYDHPEYLADVLKELFGAAYKNIIKTIEENVEDYEPREPLEEFLAIIKSTR
ncbi:MAG: hypothetical protein ACRD94_01915 [Nitrosopumilaceae archaeon]